MKGGGIRYGRSYGAESDENARSKRGSNEMNGTKSNLPYALRCVTGKDAKRASASMTRKVLKRIKNIPNPQARRPRAAQGQGVAARDVTSESEEDEEEGVELGKRMHGVRMSPAHPRYVGRGDDTCGEKWCTPYRRSGHFPAPNLKTRRGG